MHDPRVGRFFASDPLTAKYPHYTPYQFSGNRVIDAIELEGLEEFILINDGASYTIVWDITARGRKQSGINGGANQTGTVLEVNTAGTVINGIRPLNTQERAYSWIATRRSTRTPPNADKKMTASKGKKPDWGGEWKNSPLNHDADGNPNSGGYPSTGFNVPGGPERELGNVPLNFNVPPPPPPPAPVAPAPVAGGGGVAPTPAVPNPTLNIQFRGGNANFVNQNNAIAQVLPLANWLVANPTSTITLTGNTGGGAAPFGTGPAVWAAPGGGTGLGALNVGQLQQARANAVMNLLTNPPAGSGLPTIGAGRINTQRGINSPMPNGRNVGVSTP